METPAAGEQSTVPASPAPEQQSAVVPATPAVPPASTELSKAFDHLIESIRAASVRPIQTMATSYSDGLVQLIKTVDNALGMIDGDDAPKPPPSKPAKS